MGPQSPLIMIEVDKDQRKATRFVCKNNELLYKDRLISLIWSVTLPFSNANSVASI